MTVLSYSYDSKIDEFKTKPTPGSLPSRVFFADFFLSRNNIPRTITDHLRVTGKEILNESKNKILIGTFELENYLRKFRDW